MTSPKKPSSPRSRSAVAAKAAKAPRKAASAAPAAPVEEIEPATYSAAELIAPPVEELPPTPVVEAEPEALPEDVLTPEAKPVVIVATEAVPETIAEGYKSMTNTIEAATTVANEAKARLESMVAEFQDKSKAFVEKSTKAFEELGDLTKGNLEAIAESGKIASKGFETLGQDAAEYGRKSFEKTSATMKSFAAVKSPTEFFQLQSELMTSMFDTMASEASKNSEAMMKLMGDVAQPISSRVAVVSDKIKTLAA